MLKISKKKINKCQLTSTIFIYIYTVYVFVNLPFIVGMETAALQINKIQAFIGCVVRLIPVDGHRGVFNEEPFIQHISCDAV